MLHFLCSLYPCTRKLKERHGDGKSAPGECFFYSLLGTWDLESHWYGRIHIFFSRSIHSKQRVAYFKLKVCNCPFSSLRRGGSHLQPNVFLAILAFAAAKREVFCLWKLWDFLDAEAKLFYSWSATFLRKNLTNRAWNFRVRQRRPSMRRVVSWITVTTAGTFYPLAVHRIYRWHCIGSQTTIGVHWHDNVDKGRDAVWRQEMSSANNGVGRNTEVWSLILLYGDQSLLPSLHIVGKWVEGKFQGSTQSVGATRHATVLVAWHFTNLQDRLFTLKISAWKVQ